MNDSARVMRRHWRAWPPIARTAAAIIAAATLALLAAACGGSPSSAVRRLTGCRRVSELPVSGRLLRLHALARRAELSRPFQQRRDP